jgi:hypothetical protein
MSIGRKGISVNVEQSSHDSFCSHLSFSGAFSIEHDIDDADNPICYAFMEQATRETPALLLAGLPKV